MGIADPFIGVRDWIGRGLMALCALAASYAVAEALGGLGAVPEDRVWVELWRGLGFGAFALLYLVLALRPRRAAGIWEVSFLHKAGLGLATLWLGHIPEAATAGPIDAGLAAVTLLAYGLTRGWLSWRA